MLTGLESPVFFSILLALVLGAVMVGLTGSNPLEAYGEMLSGALTGSGLRNTLGRAVPIIGMALAVSLAFRSGVINLGGEGQMILGGLAGTVAAIYVPGPGLLVVPFALITGALVGGIWALLPAWGQTWLQLPILITSLLLNYVARAITGYLVRFPLADVTVSMSSTELVPADTRIPKLDLFGGISFSLLLVGGLVLGLSLLYTRSVTGYESKMAGLSGSFARYGGISVNRLTLGVMIGAGAIGGLIGTHLIIGEAFRYVEGDLVSGGVAWTGLLVALLSRNRPWFILAAGLLFSGLQVGGLAMQRNAGISWQLAQVIQAMVIVAVACRLVFPSRKTKGGAPPSELAGADVSQVGEV